MGRREIEFEREFFLFFREDSLRYSSLECILILGIPPGLGRYFYSDVFYSLALLWTNKLFTQISLGRRNVGLSRPAPEGPACRTL